ncbi:thiamine pyrophosphokinase-like protein 1 [Karstenula rhodostoma CBS 690.94]|uniref:Thiamine pyrophosphokinase n=1 Tax=Karstenula rhodostoma CBS 690.94 TaxID=1392251 RepID=A0A9P4PXJ6_9PLEO|nr:thiamine pyrophosphokinase-like protein 1 [Karstenula rhodostoma CBS 690.94]
MDAADGRAFDLALHLAQRGEREAPSDVTAAPDLLILNQPISDFTVFAQLWTRSRYRLCADGGANRLYDMFCGELEARRDDFIPDSIHGDLDSLRDDVRSYYANRGVDVSQDPDQYSTDFGKAMQKIIANHLPASLATSREVLVLGTLAGRVDQGLGLLHEMLREETMDPRLRLWLYSETNVSFILRDSHNVIKGALSSRSFTENVGILPVYGPAMISTTGLEWDVQSWPTQMGHQVSTSNHVKADELHVATDTPVLFTIERATSSTDNHATPAQ